MQNIKEEILKAHSFRRAIKEFEVDQKISEADFEFILEVGRRSPSSFGWEPWKFVVVQNMELREKLMEPSWGAQKQLQSASHFVLLLSRKGDEMRAGSDYLKYKSQVIDKLPAEVEEMKVGFFKNFMENEFDLTDDRKIFDWSCRQVYLPFANMMTAAAQIGIDSCPIEGFDRAKVEEILAAEGIVDTNKLGVAAMVAFGYRKEDSPFPQSRFPMEEVVEWVK
ncbi:NAD(P)H-dependent oxidoreductase [Ancylomarina sp. 16SWW S1-10-2]|uniref:NAD(P)H-dependent oxidoreductase n=1 Tax=Ancylomarina sp. 16SWW S1-10-2 TaxID=2499681 RepID=UPI0012AE7D7E|nr:NAD(P)H-dependent oxidoreductase [Ancylomarina sp. 16SWW S1-10-2]MRT92407.1 NAD(P)H-dependent oxidoreductase [Ancylomarina sp. 16SWW S1-10-2]